MSDEKIWLVDEDDNPIKIISRKDAKPGDIWRISSIWLFNEKGQVLIAKRASGKSVHDGLWGPSAAGTVESGEEPMENAVREVEEETGFKLNEEDLILVQKLFYFEINGTGRQVSYFKAPCNIQEDRFTLQESEVEAVKWISKDALLADVRINPDKYLFKYDRLAEILQKI
jgi:isopentenyl-diphosphate delta-isomerase